MLKIKQDIDTTPNIKKIGFSFFMVLIVLDFRKYCLLLQYKYFCL